MIDGRDFQAFLDALLERLRAALPGYAPADGDVGRGLAAIHAHYLEILVDRLNRVPAKDQAAFLDLVGVSLLAPAPARVPITFTLAPTAGQAAPVEPRTQVATQQTATRPAVVFETEARLNVVAADLVEAQIVDPGRDAWTDATALVTGAHARPFGVFEGERPLLHALHLGHARLLALRRPARLTLEGARAPQDTVWEVSTEDGWSALDVEPTETGLTVDPFPGAAPLTLRGAGLDTPRPGRWLRWRLNRPLKDTDDTVTLGAVQATVAREAAAVTLSGPLGGAHAERVVAGLVATQLAAELREGQTTAEVVSAAGFADGDLALLGEDEAAAVKRVAAGTLELTRPDRRTHPAGTPVRRLVPSLVPFGADLPLSHATGLETGDWLRSGARAQKVLAIDVGVPPDHLLVNTVPADASKPFEPFGPQPALGDALHVASADAFTKPDPGGRTDVTFDVTVRLADAELRWAPEPPRGDTTHGFTRDGTIVVRMSGAAVRMPDVTGEVRLLTVTLAAGGYQRAPVITRLVVGDDAPQGVWTSPAPVADPTHAKLTRIEPDDAFLPFGAAPVAGATLYVAVPANVDSSVLHVTLAPPPRLAWEYRTPRGWLSLPVTDGTAAFTRSGTIAFAVPDDLEPVDLNGVVAPWVRARIAGGAYGRPVELVRVDPADAAKGFTPRQGSGALNPPLIGRFAIRYTASTRALERLARNDFRWEPGGERPFRPVADTEPALYLRFDAALPDSGARLYAVSPPRQFAEVFDPPPPVTEADPQLAWELWDGRGWAPLTIADHTAQLTESGGIETIGARGMAELTRTPPDRPAGADPEGGWWIRVRRVAGGSQYRPALTHLLLNTVEAVQGTTVADEILGSSSGRRNATFRTSRRPVLPGQEIVVREPERPPQAERAGVAAASGGQGPFDVVWTPVATLAASGPRDRHYTIERLSGTVRFGDGRHGLIPPAGSDNVLCRHYRAGGGADGNQPAGAVAQLKSSIPYVATVANAVPAGGGSAPERLDQASRRGPQTLRHRGRALSADDFEWLAREAAGTGVARARALPNRDRDLRFTPGWTTVVIVPEGAERRPLPSSELVRTVQAALDDACLATLSSGVSRINVIGPGYVPVDLRVAVVPRDLGEGEATRRDVLEALERFLHPLTGGPDGTGWPLGRDVYLSEVYAALERITRVDHVAALELLPSAGAPALRCTLPPSGAPGPPEPPVASFALAAGAVLAVVRDGKDAVRARVPDALAAGTPLDALHAVLFQEGERVRIGTAETTVRTIAGSTLEVDPFLLPEKAGRVQAVERRPLSQKDTGDERQSLLVEPPAAGTLADRLRVRLVEPGDTLQLRQSGVPTQTLVAVPGLDTRLRVADSQLPYSGSHQVEIRGT